MQLLRAVSFVALTASAVVACVVVLGACLGEDVSATSDATGGEGGRCRDDGTCDPGLSCASGLCVRLDGGANGADGSTAGSTDGGATPGPDGGAAEPDGAAPTCGPPVASAITCGPKACLAGESCCSAGPNNPRGLECVSDPTMSYQGCTAVNDAPVKCLGTCDVATGTVCCGTFASAPVPADGGCGYTSMVLSSSQCIPSCGNLTHLCQSDADCKDRKCVRLTMTTVSQTVVWGICQP